MKKFLPLLALLLATASLPAQTRILRCRVLNHSHEPPRPESKVKITPAYGGNTVEQGSVQGIFELQITGMKIGEQVELYVSKPGYRILGNDPNSFFYAIPENEKEVVKIPIIRDEDFNRIKTNYEKGIQMRIEMAKQAVRDSISELQSQTLSPEERSAMNQNIRAKNAEIETLSKSKDELAAKFAQIDLSEASKMAQDALKKFKDEGDLKAALALLSDEKLDEFWKNVLTREEEVKKAKAQAVENYMVKARLLVAGFQFPLAYKNYLEAVEKDSLNLKNLWEVAYFLDKQNEHRRAIALFEKCLPLCQTGAERGGIFNNLGGLYSTNLQIPEAGKAFTDALGIYRQLAAKNPDAFLPYLATTLNNLGEYYRVNYQMPEAEKAYMEALGILRQLAAQNPDAFLPDLSTTLNNLGLLYKDNQEMPEAEKVYTEALGIRRQLAAKNSDAFLPNLANTLNNLGEYYRVKQKMPEAKKALTEALSIRRQLATQNPDAFLPDVVETLNNLGIYYQSNREMPESENAYTEALDIQRQLVEKNPYVFLPNLAHTLNNLAGYYQYNREMPEAGNAYTEAMNIYWQLAAKNPDAFLPDVAHTLNNLAGYYKDNRQMLEAGKTYTEALGILRQLADKNPNAFLPDVAMTLNNIGEYYRVNQQMPQAEKAYIEALSILRQLAAKTPDTFLPYLATTLNNLGNYYSDNLQMPEAEKVYMEALGIFQQLAIQSPDAFGLEVCRTDINLTIFYKDLMIATKDIRHQAQALELLEEATKWLQRFPPEYPTVQKYQRDIDNLKDCFENVAEEKLKRKD